MMAQNNFEAARERVKRKLSFGDEDEEQAAGNTTLLMSLSKNMKTNFDTYLKDFPLLANNSSTPGWEMILYFDLKRALSIFPEQHRENVKSLYKKMEHLIRQHYVRTQEFVVNMAHKEGLKEDDFYTTDNENIVALRRIYSLDRESAMVHEYLSLKISQDDMCTLYSYCSTFVSLVLAAKVDKSPYLARKMVEATHIACFKPFYNDFDLAFFEGAIHATPAPRIEAHFERINNAEEPGNGFDGTMDNNDFDIKREPYLILDGHLLVLCQYAQSRGSNSGGNKFNVLNLADASEQILRDYFNRFIRNKFPNIFKGLSPMMFFNVVEVRDVPKIDCLLPMSALKNKVLASVNVAKITLVSYKKDKDKDTGGGSGLVPQVQMYTNCLFTQRN